MEGALVENVRAEPFHRVTPLLESWALSQVAGMPVFLKYENVQPAGSFKIRGIGHFCQQVKEDGYRLGRGGGRTGLWRKCGQDRGRGMWMERPATSHKGLHDWSDPQLHLFSLQMAMKGCRHLVCSSGDPIPLCFTRSPQDWGGGRGAR